MRIRDESDRLPPMARGQCAKRLSILEAAAKVFCREGFAGASIDLIAAEACVSRQTVYNHAGDKESLFIAVVKDITERTNAGLFETLDTFPDRPLDLEAELVAFARRLAANCMCSREGMMLRRLIQNEGARYPKLFGAWLEHGPGRAFAAIGARLAKLAHAGYLDVDDPDRAARQLVALVNAELQSSILLGIAPAAAQIEEAALSAVRTFLRAYARRHAATRAPLPPLHAEREPVQLPHA
jgi:AcrR family transcriptional regulator